MDQIDPLVLVIGGAGLALQAIRMVLLFTTEINAPLFDEQIAKLLAAGNRDRALKLCNAAPNAAHVAAVKAMLEESRARSAHDGEGLIRESISEAYQRAVATQKRRVGRLGWLAPLGVVLAAGATFYGITGDPPAPPTIWALPWIAAVLWFASHRKARRIERGFAAAGERLIPITTAYVLEHDGPG